MIALASLCVVLATSAQRMLSLEEALRTAREHQPQARVARASLESARAKEDQALAPLLPQFAASLSYQRSTANFAARPGALPSDISSGQTAASFDTFDYFTGGVTASQLVWDFGATSSRWRAAQASAEAQAQNVRSTDGQVALAVMTAFFDARAAKSLIEVAKESLANQERHLAQVQGFVEVGTRPAIDLAQARTGRANARLQLINATNGYRTAKAQLNVAMGLAGAADFEVAEDGAPPVEGEERPPEALWDEAFRARPELAALEQQRRAQELVLRAIRGAYGPSLGISTGLTEAGAALERLAWNWSVGATLSFPFFQGGLTRAQEADARQALVVLEAQRDLVRLQIQLEVEQARLAVGAALAGLEAAGDAAENSRQRLALANGRYETGVGNAIELGDAQLSRTSAEVQVVQADYSLASARARLLKALGRL